MYHNNLEEILENDKEYEDVAAKSIPHRDDVLGALDVVRNFIKKKKLILYGGIAIDYALKHAGHIGIYAEDAVPDYDFASPNFYDDSNELADILAGEGYKNVSVINAVHITTRRVRVNYEFVADITYYPENIFAKVPTLEYNGLLFVHPNFQRMDMHIELCYPFDNPPWEVLQHRTRKTIKRFKIINEVYPIVLPKAKKVDSELVVPIKDYRGGAHLSGVVGYAILHKLVHEMFFNTSGVLAKSITKLGAVNSKAVTTFESIYNCNWTMSGNSLTLTVPEGCDYINILSFKEEEKQEGEKYYAYLDYIRPPYEEIGKVEKYDLHLKQVPCFNLTKLSKITKCDELVNLNLPIVHMILLYFLQRYHETQNENYLMLYDSTMKLCNIAESIFYTMYEQNDAKLNKMVDELYFEMPIFLSSKVCGEKSVKEAYEAYLLSSKYIIENIPRTEQVVLRPPSSYTPGDQPPQPFLVSSSPFFNISGLSFSSKNTKDKKEKKDKPNKEKKDKPNKEKKEKKK